MNNFDGAWDVRVDSKHRPYSRHALLISHKLKWDWNAELKNLFTQISQLVIMRFVCFSLTLSCDSPAFWMSPYISTSLLNVWWCLIMNDSNAVSLSQSSSSISDWLGVFISSSFVVVNDAAFLKAIGVFPDGKSYL